MLKLGKSSLKHSCKPYVYRSLCSVIKVNEWYRALGVAEGSDQEVVRQAFLKLAKRYHPDSGSGTANAEKFQKIDEAYRNLQNHFSQARWNVNDCEGEYGLYYKEKHQANEEKDFDIKHTVPQHREYLSHGGFGRGTPYQRERDYNARRAASAVHSANEYRLSKLAFNDKSQKAVIRREEKKKAKDVKTGLGIDRLVEDMIQESIAKGEFNNLKGSGKPLSYNVNRENPYVDFVTHKMNQVLIDNGYTPTWITLHKEIRSDIDLIRKKLISNRQKLGASPFSKEDDQYWKVVLNEVSYDVKSVNQKIDSFNLVVPILEKQMFHLNLNDEANKALKDETTSSKEIVSTHESETNSVNNLEKNGTFVQQLLSVFNRN